MTRTRRLLGIGAAALLFVWTSAGGQLSAPPVPDLETPYVMVLGTAQDGGYPQAGFRHTPVPLSDVRQVTCLGLVDPATSQRWLFDATPDFRVQLERLTARSLESRSGLDGILLTHAHIGHYLGLAQLGHEVMGAREIPVYAMPRMRRFLETNGPWDQLVRYGNILLRELEEGVSVPLNPRLRVTPLSVPHRQEYSEVVGFLIEGPRKSLLFIPDIDSWKEWEASGQTIEDWISRVDRAYLDGTFYADGEIPGRDMSGFPHPFIANSMRRFRSLPAAEKAKVHFIHFNHTNPVLNPDSDAAKAVRKAGFRIAEQGETFGL